MPAKILSIVTPCFNEEATIEDCYAAVKALFEGELSEYDYEHIFTDNASTDKTVEILKRIARQDKRVKLIVNARNFGPFCSMFNGIVSTSGDAVVPFLPADLQDPPEVIPEFVRNWEEGYEIVYGIRRNRQENLLMRTLRRLYYRMVNQTANIHIPPDVGEFQLLDRVVVDALRRFDDYYPYVRGMIASCGFRSTGVPYTWKARAKGLSKNRLYTLIDQGLNGLISFTNLPMRICMLVGFLLSVLSLAYAAFVTIINLIYFRQFAAAGIATLIAGMFFFGGVQLFFLGVLGEYISAVHFQVRRRPNVIERERINFSDQSPSPADPTRLS